MLRLMEVEMRRALSKRSVRALIGLALVLIGITGTIAFVNSSGFDPSISSAHIARMSDFWGGNDDNVLGVVLFFLVVGGLIAGATVTGGEWRAGTVTTVLTWEPRSVRLLSARLIACLVPAVLVAILLQLVLMGALVPTWLVHGTTTGVDAAWWGEALGAMARGALVTGLAAVAGASVASLGRNTTAALISAFVYLVFIENGVRGFQPDLGRFLIGENGAIFLTAENLETADFTRSPFTAFLTLLIYVMILAGLAIVTFTRRDVAN